MPGWVRQVDRIAARLQPPVIRHGRIRIACPHIPRGESALGGGIIACPEILQSRRICPFTSEPIRASGDAALAHHVAVRVVAAVPHHLPARIVQLADTPQPIRAKVLHARLVLREACVAIQVGVRPIGQHLRQPRRRVEHVARRAAVDRLLQAVAHSIIPEGVGTPEWLRGTKIQGY